MEDQIQNENPLELNERIKNDLLVSAKWGKFIAIVGYVSMGLLGIFGFVFLFGYTPFNQINQSPLFPMPFRFAGILYVIMAGIYYFPITYLYRYTTKIKEAVLSTNQDSLTESIENLSKMFKFMGIMTIVILALYGFVLLLTVPFLLFMQHRAF